MGAVADVTETIAEEKALRASFYRLIGRLLAAPADAETLATLTHFTADETEFGRALGALRDAAKATTPDAVAEEYQELFIGVGAGELLPYGSYYLTGFLHEKPLADLRGSLNALGIARAEGNSEPEDHIAALCEVMAGLIDGSFGAPADLATQRALFDQHIAPWGGRFFEDLEATDTAVFHKPVGRLGRLFLAIEAESLHMAE